VQRACSVVGGAVRPSVTERLLEFGAVESQDYKTNPENKGDHQRETASDEHSRHRRAPAGGRLRAKRPPGSAIPVLQAVVGDPPALRVLPWHESIMKGRLIRLVAAMFSQPVPSPTGLDRARGPREPAHEALNPGYRGIFPCQRGLRRRSLRRAMRRARISSSRVRPGSMTSSMYPRSAAM
jgi:hypothetical protein